MYMTNIHIKYCIAVVFAPRSALRDIYGNKKNTEQNAQKRKSEYMNCVNQKEGRCGKHAMEKKEEAEVAETEVYDSSS